MSSKPCPPGNRRSWTYKYFQNYTDLLSNHCIFRAGWILLVLGSRFFISRHSCCYGGCLSKRGCLSSRLTWICEGSSTTLLWRPRLLWRIRSIVCLGRLGICGFWLRWFGSGVIRRWGLSSLSNRRYGTRNHRHVFLWTKWPLSDCYLFW